MFSLSDNFKSFLKGLLQKKPERRLSWPDLALHPFVKETKVEREIRKLRPSPQITRFFKYSSLCVFFYFRLRFSHPDEAPTAEDLWHQMHESVEEIEKEKKLTGNSSERSLISTPKGGSRSNLKNAQSSPYLNALSLLEQKRLEYQKLIKDGKGRKDSGSLLTTPVKIQLINNSGKSSPKVENKNIEKIKPKEIPVKDANNISVKVNTVSLFNETYNVEVENSTIPHFPPSILPASQPTKTTTPSVNSRIQTSSSSNLTPQKSSQAEKNSKDLDLTKLSKNSQASCSGKEVQNVSASNSSISSKISVLSEGSSVQSNKTTAEGKGKTKLVKDKENDKKYEMLKPENENYNIATKNPKAEIQQIREDISKYTRNQDISLTKKTKEQEEMNEIEKCVFEFIKKNGVFPYAVRDTGLSDEFISSCVGAHLSYEMQKELMNILKKIIKRFDSSVNNIDSENPQKNIGLILFFCFCFYIFLFSRKVT
jgi:hypothetical protein